MDDRWLLIDILRFAGFRLRILLFYVLHIRLSRKFRRKLASLSGLSRLGILLSYFLNVCASCCFVRLFGHCSHLHVLYYAPGVIVLSADVTKVKIFHHRQ
ncbi:hypothetical protein GYMC52_0469 [Geobacillus sp. Y412MC52]|nr:hypothetical protein GYMC52_0469 [Geobacillus sp. Y412MC52]